MEPPVVLFIVTAPMAMVIALMALCDMLAANEVSDESQEQQYVDNGSTSENASLYSNSGTYQCNNIIYHTCTNCGPGPDCTASYRTDYHISQPETCRVRCDDDTLCQGAWFNFNPGHTGQCDYYSNCTQVRKYNGLTFYRKSCQNDTECLSYELHRYENRRGQCGLLQAAGQSQFVSMSNKYQCLQTCLDSHDCQSVTYSGGNCNIHSCDTSVLDNAAVFWKKDCHSACDAVHLQKCTNCRPGSNCPAAYNRTSQLFPSSLCRDVCVSTDCETSHYNIEHGTCDLSQCHEVDFDRSSVLFRRACYPECDEYELFKLDDSTGSCHPFLTEPLNSTASHCVDRCLNMASCLAVSFDELTKTCSFYNCTTSVHEAGTVFYCRNCLSGCNTTFMQRCKNCKPSSSCPDSYYNLSSLYPSSACRDVCDAESDCDAIYYNLNSQNCKLLECDQVDMDLEAVSFRQACYSECREYELFKLENKKGSCDPFFTETLNTTSQHCLHRCLTMSACMSVAFEQLSGMCSFYSCTSSVSATGTVFYWRNCVQECDPIETQTCINCKAGSGCNAMLQTTEYSSETCRLSCASTDLCNMAEFLSINNQCNLHECSYLQSSFGNTAYRQSCYSDCLNYKLETTRGGAFQCHAIGQDLGGVDFKFCVTKCLDMISCRGVSHNSLDMSCEYYNCSDVVTTTATELSTMKRICIPEDPPRNYTQVCLNCDVASNICPRNIISPLIRIDAECEEMCSNTVGCTLAIFDYGQCILYDCKYLTWAYGIKAYRQTYNTDCLEFKIEVKGKYIGTCEKIFTTTELPDDKYCLSECLDFDGCRAITYVFNNHTCWLHSCGNYAYYGDSVDVTFIERQCDLQTCNRVYEQKCVNCDIHSDFRFSFWWRNKVAIEANCTEVCRLWPECGAVVYHPDSSRCRMYNHTGLSVDWKKTAVRKSCRSDCSKFKITELAGYAGDDLHSRQWNIPSLDDCVHLCLDMTGCFAVTYYSSSEICYFHENTDRSEATYVTATFVFLTCDIEECERNYTQICLNCVYGPNCPVALSTDYNVATIEECENTCTSSTCLQSYFNQPYGRCQLYHCTQVSKAPRYRRIQRKSCINDCPVYEVAIKASFIGTECTNITDSGLDVVLSVYYCFETCLDMIGCMAVTYSNNEQKCTYHSSCNRTVYTLNYSYAERFCVVEDRSLGISIQTCINCGVGPDCAFYTTDTQRSMYLPYLCESNCLNYSTCGLIQYSTAHSACFYYQCTQVIQSIGQTVYRRTNNTDCLKFELFTFTGYTGNCTPMANSSMATRPQDCMDTCMDMVGCRGISLRTGRVTCYYYNCTDIVEDSSTTFIKRVCSEDFDVCDRTERQTCTNCWKGPKCQRRFAERTEYKPRNIDTSVIGNDTDYLQIWYDSKNSKEKALYCSEVDLQIGHTIHRATCTADCPKFEVFIHTQTMGNCSNVLTSHAGGLTLHYCISKCLDMIGCRSLTFNNVNMSCDYYGYCNTYSSNENYTFFRRECISTQTECVANVTQTCLNCKVSDICQRYFSSTTTYFTGDCHDLKNSSTDSDAAYYFKTQYQNQCWLYQCSFVDFSIHSLTYRDSCDPDCTKYELFRKLNVYGTCDIIGHDAGSVTIEYCIQRCLEMTGCGAVSFFGNQSVCNYHNCANTTNLLYGNTTFIERRCITEDCTGSYTQVCLNCGISSYCQRDFANLPVFSTWAECNNATENLEHAGLVTYNHISGQCTARNCSLVTRASEMIVLRKSCSSDCLRYRIRELYGYIGTCSIIGSDEGGVTSAYCLEKCLDMPGCMATNYNLTQNSKCIYYSCVDKTETSTDSITFMWKDCINDTQENVLEPIKTYLQKCLNCVTQCTQLISSLSEVKRVSECNITCPGCNMVMYNPVSETCSEYGCSRVSFMQTDSSIMLRKTNNSECLEFEIFFYQGKEPSLCNLIGYDEGLNDLDYCTEQCLDMPGCKSVGYMTTNCTYYDCTNLTTGSSTLFAMEKVCSDDTTHLLKSDLTCANPNYQKCVNCDIDPSHCQSSYASANMSRLECRKQCSSALSCEASTFIDTNCTEYQCDVVIPRNDAHTTLYKKICFEDDCQVFEIHQIENHEGVCDILRTEEFQYYPSLCFERCLRMPGCRGVTVQRSLSKCLYHTCDCSYESTNSTNSVFMWRFCLDAIGNSSFTWNITSPPKQYPDCLSTTTTTSTTSTTSTTTATSTSTTSTSTTSTPTTSTSTTSTSTTSTFTTSTSTTSTSTTTTPTTTPTTTSLSTTPSTSVTTISTAPTTVNSSSTITSLASVASSVSSSPSSTTIAMAPVVTIAPATTTTPTTVPVPLTIFIRPCFCSEGEFNGLTVEEVSIQLVHNLTISKDKTSASKRRYYSVTDKRRSAVTIGSAGVCTLVLEFCAFLIFDATKIMQTFQIIRGFLRTPV